MKRIWKTSAIWCFLAILVCWGIARAEDPRGWLILETKENGQRIIVRALSSVPDESVRQTMPWQLLIRWRYELGNNGMPTEATIQAARGIEDGLFEAMRKGGAVDLPLVRTGNGIRHWYYYVQDPKAVEESIRTFFETCPEIDVSVKAHRDEEWAELREVIIHVRH